ncbi:hypothetical protein [Granulicella arctica]|uniref:Terminase small subunit n=1 Tax=Granulicella arctica TaxID=940613 RepID=A0A7Y9PK56_9BACT|nr:hypothetical protein [Granulicella arctica]NYF80568.1 hypothetical protein [Granulicella arctica]
MAFLKNPPQYVAAETHALAATGHSKLGIAAYFGVGIGVFERWMEEDDELKEAFANGREQERHALHAALFNKAMRGDGPSAMFLLKSRHNYREGDQSDISNRVQITFNLPGAMTPEQFKTLEGVAKPTKRVTDGD